MTRDAAPSWLRPVHRWFFWWEFKVPSVYRVVAVVAAALLMAALLFVAGLHPVVGVPGALLTWIGLAIAQEHDERVVLPVDAEFHEGLRELVDPVLASRGFVFNHAFGPCRAREERTDVFLYERPDPAEACLELWIQRDRLRGTMRVYSAGLELSRCLSAAGEARLAERVGKAVSPDEDVRVLREAFSAATEDFWTF